MAFKPKSTRRKGYAPNRKAKRTGGKKFKKAVTTIVKSVTRKAAETKYVMAAPHSLGNSTLNNWTGFTSAITSSNECYKLIPDIIRGDLSINREGDEITPLSLTVKGRIVLNSRVLESTGVFVHVFFLTAKAVKGWRSAGLAPNVIPITRLLDDGQNSKVMFTGTHYNSMYKVNNDEFNVIKRYKFHLAKGSNSYNTMSDGLNILASAQPYEKGQNSKDFSCKIPMPKKLQYSSTDNDVIVQPVNYLPFMVIGWTFDSDYSETAGNQTTLVQVEAQAHMYFQDPQ